MSFLVFPQTTSSFRYTTLPLSLAAHPWIHRSGTAPIPGSATPRASGLSGRMADDALFTSYEPNQVTDSKICIDVRGEYTPTNIAVRRGNFDTEDDFKLEVPEDSDLFTQPVVGSQRSVASTVPALMNLDSLSSTGKPVRGYGSIIESLSSSRKPMPCDRSFASTGRPVRSYESVARVARSVSRTQFDRDPFFFFERALQSPFKEKMKLEEDCLMLMHILKAGTGKHGNSKFALYETDQQCESQWTELLQAMCRRFDLFSEGQSRCLCEDGFRDIRSESTRRLGSEPPTNEQRGQAALKKVQSGGVQSPTVPLCCLCRDRSNRTSVSKSCSGNCQKKSALANPTS